MDTRQCPFVSHQGPARTRISKEFGAKVSKGNVAGRSGEGWRNVVLAGGGGVFPTGLQPCKGGDMVCARGPWGRVSPLATFGR